MSSLVKVECVIVAGVLDEPAHVLDDIRLGREQRVCPVRVIGQDDNVLFGIAEAVWRSE